VDVTTLNGLLVFAMQALLFALTLILIMQEGIKLILHGTAAYVQDVTNIRRAAAYALYIADGMLEFYRESSLARALALENPVPVLVSTSDTMVAGLYAEVHACMLASVWQPVALARLLHCTCGMM
jgi:hypothetical protein